MSMYWETKLNPHSADRIPGSNDKRGAFILCRSQENPPKEGGRCDTTRWGPMGPMRKNDPRNKTPFGTEVILDTKQLQVYDIIFEVPPQGFIIYVELRNYDATTNQVGEHDPASEELLVANYDLPVATRTLHEMFRLMWEWTQVTHEPFSNNEVIAVTAAGILNRLTVDYGFTQNIMDDILAAVPPMQVARYLMGDPDARSRPPVETIGPPPPSFLEWLDSICNPVPAS